MDSQVVVCWNNLITLFAAKKSSGAELTVNEDLLYNSVLLALAQYNIMAEKATRHDSLVILGKTAKLEQLLADDGVDTLHN